MQLITDSITVDELKQMTEKMFGDLVKAVVDIKKEIMVVDAGMHSDEEFFLLEHDSAQGNLWGINLYPEFFGSDSFIVFDSMINIRPSQGNRSRSVESSALQKKIRAIVSKLVKP